MSKAKVIVIGAGVSGVAAAKTLIEAGFDDVVVLEANDRIGGRIHSVPFGSSEKKTAPRFIDLGAQWISGKNIVYSMMKNNFDFGETGITHDNQTYFSSDGATLDLQQCRRLRELTEEIQYDAEELVKSKETYGEFFNRKYFEELKKPEFEGIGSELALQLLRQAERDFTAVYALHNWNEVPASFVPASILCEGSQSMTWRLSGYKTLIDFLLKTSNKSRSSQIRDKIFVNQKVVNVSWESDEIVVKCHDGSEYSADHVISTIPHGVLRARHSSLFTPALPAEKISAIEGLGFGTLGKVFFEFEETFFVGEKKIFNFLWTTSDLDEIRGTDKEWLSQFYGFSHVDGEEKWVEGLIAGELIREFETYPDDKLINDCLWLFEKFLKKSFKVLSFKRTRWLTDDNFLGSYAHLTTTGRPDAIQLLGKPICDDNDKPKLLFGGEATSEHHQGYVHGAYEMGLRVAQEIVDFYDD